MINEQIGFIVDVKSNKFSKCLTMEELSDSEKLCNYCGWTDYGYASVNTNQFNQCEGSRCPEAYENYLENNNITENIVKYSKKVKLINKGDF